MAHLHAGAMLRVAVAMCGPDDGEDALQDALVSALRAYPDLDPDADVRSWLLRIVHNRAIDQRRARARRPIPTEDLAERPAPGAAGAPDRELWGLVSALPPKQRVAVTLRFLADLSHREIGELMDTTEGAARRNT
ncbi:MAG: RNA polymerase sigma factor, partial [Miltoncostaeaceae bacterium]